MIDDIAFQQWPISVPRPTVAAILRADKAYQADLDPNDNTDWPCGLVFVMATYNRELWWKYFFPDEKP